MKIKNIQFWIILLCSVFYSEMDYSQITGVGHSSTANTSYTNGATNDVIYIYCNDPQTNNTGTLTATPTGGTGPFSFNWYEYDSGTNGWLAYSNAIGATSTINGLADGGYFVTITDSNGNPAGCFRAWVFLNYTEAEAGAPISGCTGFNLSGTPNPDNNFVYYNPPPNPLVIDATTDISVCFSATHTWISDIAFYVVGPPSCGSPTVLLSPNPGAIGQGTVCNSGDNVNSLCFSTSSGANFDACANAAPYTGTYGSYGPGNTAIDWSPFYGCDASSGGFSVQIYDCIGGDVGALTNSTITLNGVSACGPINADYNSGAINSAIDDNSCDAASASIFTVPQPVSVTTPIVLNNSITSVSWSTGATTNNTNVATPPSQNTMYYYTVTDNFGCSTTDSVLFTNTCVCNIDNFTANISAADCTPGTFSIDGTVEFTNAPTTGTLTVTNCSGDVATFNAPFTSPINYNIPDITADGTTNCSVTAAFSDAGACTANLGPFTEPICNCAFTLIDVTIGACNTTDNTFTIDGSVEFQSAPTTGTLVIEDCNGNAATFNAPFTSPQVFSIPSIPADGTTNCQITAYFTDDLPCEIISPTYDNPTGCQCGADIGSLTTTATGDGITDYILCFGDQVDINSNLDYSAPDDENIAGITYDPGLAYLVYQCPPTVFNPDELTDINGNWIDPCIVGIASFGDDFQDVNTLGGPSYVGTYTDNTIYYVPITMYSNVDGIYAIGFPGGDWCYDMGTPIAVQYLPEITTTETTDCNAATATITINGGLPEIDGSSFTVSNLLPATATFDNTTCIDGGTITISGLQNGDMYSFDIIDDNGCPISFSSGPFVEAPTADAGTDDTECSLTYTLAANPSFGTGTWTGPAGSNFASANSPTSSVTVNAAGSYDFTWTETTGVGCTSSDIVTIQFSDIQYTEVVNNSTCGNADGDITLTGNSGIAPYSYSIDNGTTTQAGGAFATLGSGTYNVVVEDNIGCQATGTINITDLGGPTIDAINGNDISCNAACDGDIAINATGATQFSIDNGTTFQATNNFAGLCEGNYDIVVQDALGCAVTGNIVLTEPIALTHTTTKIDLECANQCIGEIDITAAGGTPPYQYSIDNGTTTSTNGLFQNLCGGTYDVLVTDLNNCTTTSQVIITEPNPITITIGIFDATCFGQCNGSMNSIPAGGSAPYSYTWSPAIGGNVPLVTNLCAGAYDLTVTDDNGCTLDTNGIVVGAPTAVTIDNVAIVDETCGGDCTGEVTVTSTGATSFSINGGAASANNVFSNLCAGNYTILAEDVNGCSATAPAVITGPPPVTVTANGISNICNGESTSLTAVGAGGIGPYTYLWDNGDVTATTNVTPATPGQTFCVTAFDAGGCPSAAPACINVIVNEPLSVIALSDQAICEGETAQISALGSGGNGGPYIYTWDQGVGVGQNQSVSPAFQTTYTVSVTDNCTTTPATAQVTIDVNTIPNISFQADVTEGCAPVAVNFTADNVPVGSNYLWSFGDGGASQDGDLTSYSFENPGCWDISLDITTPEGCQSSTSIPGYICVYDYPTPQFNFGPQPTTILDPTIVFENTTPGNNSYTWTFDTDGVAASSNAINPSYTFSDPGIFEVCLDALSINGCPGSICQNVEILEEFLVYVPNAFTPDGDEINNEFAPIISGITPDSYEFLVFNRWGQLLFQSQIPGKGWTGIYNGVMSQQDVYVWKLKVEDQLGKTHEYIGHVTLVK